jgi:NAD(P)H-hydrate epimerase
MNSISYIDAKTAQTIDEKLMNQNGFSIDQLMELAGFSVANAVHDYYTGRYGKENPKSNRKLLIYCGPGNNGGDGLVAARHLKHFGYLPSIIYPKQGKTQLFSNLVKQCIDLEIDILSNIPSIDEMNQAQMIVDGLFGFSFSGPLRSPFDSIIQSFIQTKTPIFSIDLPSGWDVNEGDIHQTGFLPEATISLTLPKNCMKQYQKVHYVGGRFVPKSLAKEFGLTMPDYGYGPSQVREKHDFFRKFFLSFSDQKISFHFF